MTFLVSWCLGTKCPKCPGSMVMCSSTGSFTLSPRKKISIRIRTSGTGARNSPLSQWKWWHCYHSYLPLITSSYIFPTEDIAPCRGISCHAYTAVWRRAPIFSENCLSTVTSAMLIKVFSTIIWDWLLQHGKIHNQPVGPMIVVSFLNLLSLKVSLTVKCYDAHRIGSMSMDHALRTVTMAEAQ